MPSMKRLIAISLVAFTLAVIGLVVYGFTAPEKGPRLNALNGTTTGRTTTSATDTPATAPVAASATAQIPSPTEVARGPSAPVGTAKTVLTMEEVAKHNVATDCWLLIDGKAYDITQYIAQDLHPDGNGSMVPSCGTESTQAYETKGRARGRPHSARAEAELAQYYVGDVTS